VSGRRLRSAPRGSARRHEDQGGRTIDSLSASAPRAVSRGGDFALFLSRDNLDLLATYAGQ